MPQLPSQIIAPLAAWLLWLARLLLGGIFRNIVTLVSDGCMDGTQGSQRTQARWAGCSPGSVPGFFGVKLAR